MSVEVKTDRRHIRENPARIERLRDELIKRFENLVGVTSVCLSSTRPLLEICLRLSASWKKERKEKLTKFVFRN